MDTDSVNQHVQEDKITQRRSLRNIIKSKFSNEKAKNIFMNHLLPIILFLLLAIFIFRGIIGVEGEIIQGDYAYPPELERFYHRIQPIWDDYASTTTLSRLPRLLFYAPFFALGFLFGMDTTQMLLMVFIFVEFLAGTTMYYSSRYMLKKTYGNNSYRISVASMCAGFSYMWSHFLIFNSFYPHIRAAYALAPLTILALIIGLEKKKPQYIIAAGFLWALSCMDPHWIVHGAILLFSIVVFYLFLNTYHRLSEGRFKAFLRSFTIQAKSSMILVMSFFCFSFYWFLPGMMMGGTSRYMSIIYEESSEVYYSRATMTNMMGKQASHFQPSVILESPPDILASTLMQNIMVAMGLTVFVFAMMALKLRPKNRYVLYFSSLAIFTIFMGSMPLFSNELYVWFVNDAPLSGFYGWDFKWPIISQFIVLSISFLLAFSFMEVSSRLEGLIPKRIHLRKVLTLLIIGIIIFSIALPKWPLATGDMAGWFKPEPMPDDFDSANDWLQQQEGDFKVLWLPKYRSLGTDWYEGRKVNKDMAGLYSSKPTYIFWSPQIQPNGYGLHFFSASIFHLHDDSFLYSNTTNNMGSILAPLGIKYILFHDDNATYWSERERDKSDVLLDNLMHQEDLELVATFGFIYIFENKYHDRQEYHQVFTSSSNYLLYGGLANIPTLNSIPDFSSKEDGLIFADSKFYNIDEMKSMAEGLILTRSTGTVEIISPFIDDKYYIFPFDYTNHNTPYDEWSNIRFNHYGNIVAHKRGNLEDWDRDYDKGIAYTWAQGTIDPKGKLSEYDAIVNYDFEGTFHDFETQSSNMTLSLSNITISGNTSLLGTIKRGEENTNQIASGGFLEIPLGSSRFRISANISGNRVNNLQLRVRYYDTNRKYIGRDFVFTKSGGFDFTRLEKDITVPSGTEFISMQILADQNTIADSYWWADDIKVYDLRNITKYAQIVMDFSVEESTNYYIYLRHLQSESGGNIDFQLDGGRISLLDTYEPFNAFSWDKLANVRLNAGSHKLMIRNIAGFNALNLVMIIPEQKMNDYCDAAMEFLDDMTVTYALEAETDLYLRNAKVTDAYGSQASRGEIMVLSKNGEARLPLEILKPGNYTMCLRMGGRGYYDLLVTLGNYSYNIDQRSDADFSWINVTNLDLEKDTYDFVMTLPSERVIINQSFEEGWNASMNAPTSWYSPRSGFSASLDPSVGTDGNFSLKLTTNSTLDILSLMNSHNFTVKSDRFYVANIDVKTENARSCRVTIHGFNDTTGHWDRLGSLINRLNGTSEWTGYSDSLYVPEDITNLMIAVNIGPVLNETEGNATVWFDNFTMVRDTDISENEIDMILMYSSSDQGTEKDLFPTTEAASVTDYKKIDATRYELKVSSEKPFTLIFAEAYDEFWVAHVDGQGEIESIPIYSMLNGFYITRTGNFTVIIEYKPQQWYNIGSAVTGLGMVGSVGYFIWVDRKLWGSRLNTLYRRMKELVKISHKKK